MIFLDLPQRTKEDYYAGCQKASFQAAQVAFMEMVEEAEGEGQGAPGDR